MAVGLELAGAFIVAVNLANGPGLRSQFGWSLWWSINQADLRQKGGGNEGKDGLHFDWCRTGLLFCSDCVVGMTVDGCWLVVVAAAAVSEPFDGIYASTPDSMTARISMRCNPLTRILPSSRPHGLL